MGRNRGHLRGDSAAAYGELSMVTVTRNAHQRPAYGWHDGHEDNR
jgi:hypothetical protein